MTDHAFVIRRGCQYLARPFHHTTWTTRLILARHFYTEDLARSAAASFGGEPVLVEIKETQ